MQESFESLDAQSRGYLTGAETVEHYDERIRNLCESYDQVYESALRIRRAVRTVRRRDKSESGMASATAANMQQAIGSQLEYFQTLLQDVEKVTTTAEQSTLPVWGATGARSH